nr:hypothetical protein BaRGS_015653 [Batillaria attramentaria]
MAEFLHAANIKLQDRGTTVIVSASTGGQLKANLVQYRKQPLRPERRYYRVAVVDIDTVQYIMTGINFYCWPNRPEWNIKNSIRYHSNEGGIFNVYSTVGFAGTTATVKVEWPTAPAKDIDLFVNRPSCWLGWSKIERDDTSSTATLAEPITSGSKAASLTAPRHFDRVTSSDENKCKQGDVMGMGPGGKPEYPKRTPDDRPE